MATKKVQETLAEKEEMLMKSSMLYERESDRQRDGVCVTFSLGVDELTERSRLLDGSISIGDVSIVALHGDV